MRFLADESCDFAVVRGLRAAGHDVIAISETSPGATDEVVIDLSVRETRILLTEDKDFGQLVYASARMSVGVVLIRFPTTQREALCRTIVDLVSERGEGLAGRFVVVQPGRIRIS